MPSNKAKSKKRKKYTEQDKALALATLDANAGSLRKTSEQLRIPVATLDDWSKGRTVTPKIEQLRTENKIELSEKLDNIAHLLADAIPAKIDRASLLQASTSLAIAIDKMRLLREQPTQINQNNVNLTESERTERITSILDRARTRRAG